MGGREAGDLIELGHEGRGGHRADARRRREALHDRVGGKVLREPPIRGGDLLVEPGQERDQRRQLRGERRRQREGGELGPRVLGRAARQPEPLSPDQGLGESHIAGPGAHQGVAHREFRAHVAVRIAAPVGRPIRLEPEGVGQSARIAPVGLHPRAPGGVHRRVIGIGDDHGVAQRLEVAGHPLALRRGLEQEPRGGPRSEHCGEALGGGADPPFDHLALLGQDAELALALVQIESDILPGWPPGGAALTA